MVPHPKEERLKLQVQAPPPLCSLLLGRQIWQFVLLTQVQMAFCLNSESSRPIESCFKTIRHRQSESPVQVKGFSQVDERQVMGLVWGSSGVGADPTFKPWVERGPRSVRQGLQNAH